MFEQSVDKKSRLLGTQVVNDFEPEKTDSDTSYTQTTAAGPGQLVLNYNERPDIRNT